MAIVQVIGNYRFWMDYGDGESGTALYSNATTDDEAIKSAAGFLWTNKADSCPISIRRDGFYLATVTYHGWNGGRIEVEHHQENGEVWEYHLDPDTLPTTELA